MAHSVIHFNLVTPYQLSLGISPVPFEEHDKTQRHGYKGLDPCKLLTR